MESLRVHRSASGSWRRATQELADRADAERKEGDKAAAQAARVDPDRD
jgi:hypothetical protein